MSDMSLDELINALIEARNAVGGLTPVVIYNPETFVEMPYLGVEVYEGDETYAMITAVRTVEK